MKLKALILALAAAAFATTANAGTVDTTFQAQMNILPDCSISATDLVFPNSGLLQANVDASSSITVHCNAGMAYNLEIDGGLHSLNGPLDRRMEGTTAGNNYVSYGLFQDASRSIPWGAQLSGSQFTGMGTGDFFTHTVYGRVPPQLTPLANSYLDVLNTRVVF